MADVSSVVLSFARADDAGDPYAFRLGQQRYLLLGAGGGTQEAELNWDQALLADLAAIRRPQRDPAVVQRVGEKLRRFLAPAGWPQHEARILEAVQAQRQVVLTLRSAAAEIYALPWELLTLKVSGQHVGELPGVVLSYEWPETVSSPEPARQAQPAAGGRILFGWSAAGGAVPAAEHQGAIARACAGDSHLFDLEKDVVSNTSLRRLAEALEAAQRTEQPITVLHLLCHGRASGATFGLALDGDDGGEPAVVDAGGLRRMLSPYVGTLRLVVLAACDGGNAGELGNHLGSIAQALHRIGIAKVVASRYPLSVAGSIRLAEVLYRELLTGAGSIDAALLELRKDLFRDAAHLDWASLQLYARAADGAFQPASYLRRQSGQPPVQPTLQPPATPLPLPPVAAAPAAGRWRLAVAVGGILCLLGVGAKTLMTLRDGGKTPPTDVRTVLPAQPTPAAAPPDAAVAVAATKAPAAVAVPTIAAPTTPIATTGTPKPAVRHVEPPRLFNVTIRSDSGNSIRVAGQSKTAAVVQRGNQAQASFQLTAGTHQISCTDSLTHQTTQVSIRVVDGENNATDCPPH